LNQDGQSACQEILPHLNEKTMLSLAFLNQANVVSDKNELAITLVNWKKFQIPSYSGVFIGLHFSR